MRNVKATWYISVEGCCPNCGEVFDLIAEDEDFFSGGVELCEQGTECSTNLDWSCKVCEHEFLVDLEY